MDNLAILWGIFSFLFFALAIYHFWLSTKRVQHLDIPRLEGVRNGIETHIGVGHGNIDDQAEAIERQVNVFIDDFNKGTKRVNIAQGIGYSLALATSLVSAWITL